MQISIEDADRRLKELAELVEAGEEVVLTRSGLPVARMVLVAETSSPDNAPVDVK